MKSERRHELQQNELAIYLGKINQAIEPYSRWIVGGLLVVIVASLGWMLYNTSTTEKRSDATLQLIRAIGNRDPEVFTVVTNNYPDTAAGAWAQLFQGQRYLAEGVQELYQDRANAEDLLASAQSTLRAAMESSADLLLRSRAQFGIARALESLGEVEDAISAYEDVISIGESEAMIKKCRERIDALQRDDTRAFLAWFADQDFSPADPSLPPALEGLDSLPSMPDLELPGLGIDGDSEAESKPLPEGGLELPLDNPGEADAPAQSDDAATESADAPAADQPTSPSTETDQSSESGGDSTESAEASPESENP